MLANPQRLRLAAGVALGSIAAVAGIVAVTARAEGALPLPPDLVPLSLDDEELVMAGFGERTALRFSSEVTNRGVGPLEVFASPASANCDGDGDPSNDRDASQRLFADTNFSGVFERGADAVARERHFGCMRYHPPHDHWHVLGFALYRLRSERSGRLVATTRKLGFCLGDNRPAFADPGAPAAQVYPAGSPDPRGCTETTIQGLSVGWADIYRYDVPGQAFHVAGLARGRYCLIARADPDDLLDEVDEGNNVRRTRIALDPKRPSVRKLNGGCRLKSRP